MSEEEGDWHSAPAPRMDAIYYCVSWGTDLPEQILSNCQGVVLKKEEEIYPFVFYLYVIPFFY